MSEEYPTLAITDNGDYAPLNVRLLLPGTSDHERLAFGSDGPIVEFYDLRYAHTVYGQFVARYALETILDVTGGLSLDLGTPAWTLTAGALRIAVDWANSIANP